MTIEGAIAVTQNNHRILLTSVRSCEGYVDSAVQGTCKHRMEHINTHIFSVLAVDTDDAITRSYMRVPLLPQPSYVCPAPGRQALAAVASHRLQKKTLDLIQGTGPDTRQNTPQGLELCPRLLPPQPVVGFQRLPYEPLLPCCRQWSPAAGAVASAPWPGLCEKHVRHHL